MRLSVNFPFQKSKFREQKVAREPQAHEPKTEHLAQLFAALQRVRATEQNQQVNLPLGRFAKHPQNCYRWAKPRPESNCTITDHSSVLNIWFPAYRVILFRTEPQEPSDSREEHS